MGIYRSEIANLRKNIGENIGQKIIVKESPILELNLKMLIELVHIIILIYLQEQLK